MVQIHNIRSLGYTVSFVFLSFLILSSNSMAAEITVAAAANLDPVMGKLVTAFNEDSSVTVKVTTGASGKFVSQIENGAPFDVFMSADMKFPEVVYKEGLALTAPKVYARGGLVLWTIKSLDLSKGMDILKDPSVSKISIAAPNAAPYGREAVNVFKYYGTYQDVKVKLVYGESLAQANTFVMTGAADIGITAKSTVLSGKAKDAATWIDVPMESYTLINQGVVVLSYAQGEAFAAAKSFVDFLFTDKAKIIFKESGYDIP